MKDAYRPEEPVLVTGASGFIGRRVLHKLLERGIDVRALVLPEEDLPPDWDNRVDVVRGRITDAEAVKAAMCGAGTAIHLVAVVTDWADEQNCWDITVEGSRLLYEEAVRNTTRVVLASSVVVYGDKIHREVCPESTKYGKSLGVYSRTKQAQEKLAWEFHREKGMALSVIRPGNVYGPASGPWLHDVLDVIRTGMPMLVSGGDFNAGLAYVDNVADVLILAASATEALGQAYNACDGFDVTWKQYFLDIARMISAPPPRSIPRFAVYPMAVFCEFVWSLLRIKKRPFVTREGLNLVGSDNRFPTEKLRQELGYEPRIGYAEAMREVESYLRNMEQAEDTP